MAIQRDLKAFVRYDGSGRVVAGSLVLRKNKPKVGRWKEIQAYECCNYVPTTTTTTTASYSYYLGSPCAGGANIIIRSTVTLSIEDGIYHSNNNCCTIFATTVGPIYEADYVSMATCEACPITTTTTTTAPR